MTERIHNITRAICRQADGSRADGRKMVQLPMSEMSPNVNLAAINHLKVVSDADRLAARLFLTDYCEALSRALNCNVDFHKNEVLKSESKGRLVTEYSIRFDKNRTPIQNGINVLSNSEHESLPPLNFKSHYKCKCTHIFE